MLQELLAVLHGIHWNHQTTHWQAEGENFYSNHLLFQRLYEGLPEQYDGLAEKMVSYFGKEAVDQSIIIERSKNWTEKWSKTSEPIKRAIQAEHDLQKMLKKIYENLKEKNEITLGLDDFLMGLANDHETHLYLLGHL